MKQKILAIAVGIIVVGAATLVVAEMGSGTTDIKKMAVQIDAKARKIDVDNIEAVLLPQNTDLIDLKSNLMSLSYTFKPFLIDKEGKLVKSKGDLIMDIAEKIKIMTQIEKIIRDSQFEKRMKTDEFMLFGLKYVGGKGNVAKFQLEPLAARQYEVLSDAVRGMGRTQTERLSTKNFEYVNLASKDGQLITTIEFEM